MQRGVVTGLNDGKSVPSNSLNKGDDAGDEKDSPDHCITQRGLVIYAGRFCTAVNDMMTQYIERHTCCQILRCAAHGRYDQKGN